MNDERGQAVLVAALILAVAALAITGLRIAEERILAHAVRERSGEAAVEAATAVVADAYAEARRATASPTPNVRLILADPALAARARTAADELSRRNGGVDAESLEVRCDAGEVEVILQLSGARYRAGFHAAACSPR